RRYELRCQPHSETSADKSAIRPDSAGSSPIQPASLIWALVNRPKRVDSGATDLIQFFGGQLGNPRGVLRDHRQFSRRQCLAVLRVLPSADDVNSHKFLQLAI